MKTLSKTRGLGLVAVIVAAMIMTSATTRAEAQGYLGGIRIFANNFCPAGFSQADGSLRPIAENDALFALIGTTYGGDGQEIFALPDLRGRTSRGTGQGNNLSSVLIGEASGAEEVTLTVAQIPPHSHGATTSVNVQATLQGTSNPGDRPGPNGKILARANPDTLVNLYSTSAPNVSMAPSSILTSATATTTINPSGGGQPIDIRSPYLGLSHCIAESGIFPTQN